ncbi:MAG: GAF domain-containing protein [Chloroflexi bacterium]|nr:GAF domain-containing protein [Chloroflexota bacterium]
MSTPQTPVNAKDQTWFEQVREFVQYLIAPYPSIQEIGLSRRAQLLNVFSAVLSLGLAIGLIVNPSNGIMFGILLGVSIVSFFMGKWKFPVVGTMLFSIGILSAAYISLYLGSASNYLITILSLVPLALIVASALTDRITFIGLVFYATLTTILASINSKAPLSPADVPTAGGIVLFIGAILYGILEFRANLEKSRLEEVRLSNQKMRDAQIILEDRLIERTRSLAEANQQIEERTARLQTISEISQEISANMELQSRELFTRITRTISEKLNFYHVGIFLLDENREYAVLRAANSLGGQHMLARRHQLKVGGTGIVGYVSQSGRPRIALDTGTDAVFFNNPDLPKTRSEIALPLKYGAQIIGVLDVQSTDSSAFKDEDVNTLGTLANQISVIINNVLTNENPQYAPAFMKMDRTLNPKQKTSGYSYLSDGTITTDLPANSLMFEKALASGETEVTAQPSKNIPSTLAVPVKFRDRVIGIIHIQASQENRRWTDDEIMMVQSISERAAFALENARLFEETMHRADQEETIARVTTHIGASTDFDRILQTTIQELGQALGVSRSFIQMGTPPENENN